MVIFAWQLLIIFFISICSFFFGVKGCVFSSVVALIWTIIMIFTSWLMILQFVTVGIGFLIGLALLESKVVQKFKENSLWFLLIISFVITWLIDNQKPNSTSFVQHENQTIQSTINQPAQNDTQRPSVNPYPIPPIPEESLTSNPQATSQTVSSEEMVELKNLQEPSQPDVNPSETLLNNNGNGNCLFRKLEHGQPVIFSRRCNG